VKKTDTTSELLSMAYSIASEASSTWSDGISSETNILLRLIEGTPKNIAVVGFSSLPDEVAITDFDRISTHVALWYEDERYYYRAGVKILKETLSSAEIVKENMISENKLAVEQWALVSALDRENRYLRAMVAKLIKVAQNAARTFRNIKFRIKRCIPPDSIPEEYTFHPGAHTGTLRSQVRELVEKMRIERRDAEDLVILATRG